jgi:serine/threonine protein kinase/TolB-like protein
MALMSQLLDEALPLDDAGRRAWLERLPLEHGDLAAALREALLPDEAQAAYLQALMSPPKLSASEEVDAPAASGLQPGARVGPYELIRLLGVGGMAEVWLARRADRALKREIALKLPMRDRLRSGLEARFARERDILASLEHPLIARLYDAGVGPEGLSYFAMEYVRGDSLTEWSDAHRLAIRARLALFLQVLEAVQYAHQKQVTHRDLKPSNILVNESGQVRLLDFGIARLLGGDETDQTALTSVYGRALTPDYASPELLRGDPIDARSDLYSLGVLLYELLSGARPYRLKNAASLGLLDQAIATLEIKKPSAQLVESAAAARGSTVAHLKRQLRGDLDAIVLMALAKEPAQRYPSALAMAEDLRRFLDNRPVRARPRRAAYRLRKFVHRHAALLGICLVAVVAVLGAVAYTLHRDGLTQVTVVAPAMKSISDKTIAVLPFVDMSEKKDQEYFADGMAEEIIDLLVTIPGLKVIARTSSFQFKGKTTDLRSIGTALGVAYVLEGSVRKSGDRLRVTAQLIDSRDGTHLMSQSYDRDVTDVLKMQDEIAAKVVRALQLQVASSAFSRSLAAAPSAEAYDAYLRGLHARDRFDKLGFEEALADFRQALQLEPSFYPAAEAESSTLYYMTDSTYLPPESGFNQARAAAEAALAIHPASAIAHAVICSVNTAFDWAWSAAARECAVAARMAPNNPFVLQAAAVQHMALGEWKDAASSIETAIENDPFDPALYNIAGRIYLRAGRVDDAQAAVRRALQISPTAAFDHLLLGISLLMQDRPAAALAEMRQENGPGAQALGLAIAYHALHRDLDSDAAVARLRAENGADSAFFVAEAYAFCMQKDAAFSWLQRALIQRDDSLYSIKGAPLLRNLESDPRYKALLGKMNLPE